MESPKLIQENNLNQRVCTGSKFQSLREKIKKEIQIQGRTQYIRDQQKTLEKIGIDQKVHLLDQNISVGTPNLGSQKKQISFADTSIISKKQKLKNQIFKQKNDDNKQMFESEFHSKYELIDGLIGEGAHGQVKKCRLKIKNEEQNPEKDTNQSLDSDINTQNSFDNNSPNKNQNQFPIFKNQKQKFQHSLFYSQDNQSQSQQIINNKQNTICDDQQKNVYHENIQPSITFMEESPKEIRSRNKTEYLIKQPNNNSRILTSQQSILQSVKENSVFAVKIVRSDDEEIIIQIQQTFKIQKLLNQVPSIGKSYELFIDTNNNYIYQVMEFVDWPSLGQILSQKKQLPEQQVQQIIKSLTKAVNEMHTRGICHRDLKPDNIMVNPNNYSQIKIIDFGIARKFIQSQNKFNTQKNDMWTMTGTLQYKAPEMFQFGYTELVDIWAIGIITYEMLCGQLPFNAELQHDLIDKIEECDLKFKEIKENTTNFNWENNKGLAKDFLRRLISKNKRLNSTCAMNHLWLNNHIKQGTTTDDISIKNQQTIPGLDNDYTEIVQNLQNFRQSSYMQQNKTPKHSKHKPNFKLNKSPKKIETQNNYELKETQSQEEQSSEEDTEVRVRNKTRTLLTDFIADNSEKDVHKSQLYSPCSSSISIRTINDRIQKRKLSVKLQRSPKTSIGDLHFNYDLNSVKFKQDLSDDENENDHKNSIFSTQSDDFSSKLKQKQILKKSHFSPCLQPNNFSDQIEELQLNCDDSGSDSDSSSEQKQNQQKNNEYQNNNEMIEQQ